MSPQAMLLPRKLPRQPRAAATVEGILEAAAGLLEAEGLEAFTTNAVAARAGVSIGSLYQYFPGKAALSAALIERETAGLREGVRAAELLGGFEGPIDAMIAAAVAHHVRRPALARVLAFVEGGLPAEARTFSGAVFAAAIARIVSRRIKGSLATEAGWDLVAIVRGVCDLARERGDNDAESLRRRLHRAVYGYLRVLR